MDRPALPTQPSEVVAESESADQADRRARPFCRRAEMIARPARVCIRLRKPCLRARFLVFGWYVRFIEGLLSATLASSGRGAPGVPSIWWVPAYRSASHGDHRPPSSATARPTSPSARRSPPSSPSMGANGRKPTLRLRAWRGTRQPTTLRELRGTSKVRTINQSFEGCPQCPQCLHRGPGRFPPEYRDLSNCGRRSRRARERANEQVRRNPPFGLARGHPQAATLPRPQRGRSRPPMAVFRAPAIVPQVIPHLWKT
jgi:hypothetical protein